MLTDHLLNVKFFNGSPSKILCYAVYGISKFGKLLFKTTNFPCFTRSNVLQ